MITHAMLNFSKGNDMPDMDTDIFAEQPYGRAALKKMAANSPLPENFPLYCAEWLGDKKNMYQTLKVTGAEFRAARMGPYKGKLSVLLPDTKRTVYLSPEEARNNEV